MGRVSLTDKDKLLRPHLIEYDRANPSPSFTPEMIAWIESIRGEFTDAELSLIREYEYHVFNKAIGILVSHEIPGLRGGSATKTRYVKRFNSGKYETMMDEFLDFNPPGLAREHILNCNLPAYRISAPHGEKFYPISYHGDIDAWRRQISEGASYYRTTTGGFERGKFVVSDGRTFNFSDLVVESLLGATSYPLDW